MIDPIEKGPAGFFLAEIDVMTPIQKIFPDTIGPDGIVGGRFHGSLAWVKHEGDDTIMIPISPRDGDWSGLTYKINPAFVNPVKP